MLFPANLLASIEKIKITKLNQKPGEKKHNNTKKPRLTQTKYTTTKSTN